MSSNYMNSDMNPSIWLDFKLDDSIFTMNRAVSNDSRRLSLFTEQTTASVNSSLHSGPPATLPSLSSLITHVGIDGIAAACIAIANHYDGDIYAVGSEGIQIETMIEPYFFVTIVDLSITKAQLMEHFYSHNFSIFDHHARNSFLNQYENCFMDPRSCACKLYYNHHASVIYPANNVIKHFVDLVDVIDRWQFDNPLFDESRKLFHLFTAMMKSNIHFQKRLIYSKGQVMNTRFKPFIEAMLKKLSYGFHTSSSALDKQTRERRESSSAFKYSSLELEMIRREEAQLETDYLEALKTLQFRVDDRRRIFGVCKSIGNVSLVSNEMMKRHPDIKYILLYKEIDKKISQISARSRSIDIDMNELDGLEGHPLAAGAYMSSDFIRDFIENRNAYLATVKHTTAQAPPMRIRRTRGAPPSQLIQRINHK